MARTLAPPVVFVLLLLSPSPLLGQWPARGLTVTQSIRGINPPASVVPDGHGGTYLLWHEDRDGYRLILQRVTGSGAVATGWPVGGLQLTTGPLSFHHASMVPVSGGGVIVAWVDARSGQDIYANRINEAGLLHPGWPAMGLPVCVATGQQLVPRVVVDGQGGAFIAWRDFRVSSPTMRVSRVDLAGTMDPAWTPGGVSLGSTDFYDPFDMVSDGVGGLFVGWSGNDNRVRVIRLLGGGVVAPGWSSSGRVVSAGSSIRPDLSTDGIGGVFIAWMDGQAYSTNRWDTFATHLLADGSTAIGAWGTFGRRIGVSAGEQQDPDIGPDGQGGIFILWRNNACWPGCSGFTTFGTRLGPNGFVVDDWTLQGRALTGDGTQDANDCVLLSDGAGGGIAGSLATGAVHLQRFLKEGETAPTWPAEGLFVNLSPDFVRPGPVLFAEDDRGGAYSTWVVGEHSLSLQRVTSDGRVCGFQNEPPTVSTSVGAAGAVRILAGESLEFSSRFQDPEGDSDALIVESVSALPRFVTVDPPLPAAGSPVTLLFLATPEAADAGVHEIVIRARDRCDAEVVARLSLTVVANEPPDCSGALARLIPGSARREEFQPVEVLGVVDPDGDSFSIRVTSIRQDEDPASPVSGGTCPDARLVAGAAEVRLERDGSGDGRAYHLGFTATDARGGTCEGTAVLCLAHDNGRRSECVDGGPRFESLECPGGGAGRGARRPGGEIRVQDFTRSTLTLEVDAEAVGESQFELFDVSGRLLVPRWQGALHAGANNFEFPSARLVVGLYFLRIHREGLPTQVLRMTHLPD